MDTEVIEEWKREKSSYLQYAVENYLKTLIASNKKPQMSPIGRRDLEDRKNYVSS